MIKGKTKVSGGYRSEDGGIRFGNIMSIIKTIDKNAWGG